MKEKDLQGMVKLAANLTKRKEILPKFNDANARIAHLETLASSLHTTATEMHKSATGALNTGFKALQACRKENKSVKAVLGKCKDSRDKARAELNRLKDKQESAKIISDLKEKELKRMESELTATKKELATEKKELEEVRRQLREGGSGNAQERALQLQREKS